MSAPRLEVDLDKISHNALTLVQRLARRGISVTGVTKAILGAPDIANLWLKAGASGIGDSRIENLETMRRAGVSATMTLIRTPMLSQADRVVAGADVSFNTELSVIRRLSSAARTADRMHGIVFLVELGDLREGIMCCDLENVVRETLRLPNIHILGIGANLACRSGVAPDARNMAELSSVADSIARVFNLTLEVVTGGNSANLNWALGDSEIGRINDLRLGESLLLGREPLHREPIRGLYTNAMTLVAEVIESKVKPSRPWGEIAQTAFGASPAPVERRDVHQSIVAIGRQDVDPDGLRAQPGIEILAASSDHLILDSGPRCLPIGAEIKFEPNYSALLRAMTSPYVMKILTHGPPCDSEGLFDAFERRNRTGPAWNEKFRARIPKRRFK